MHALLALNAAVFLVAAYAPIWDKKKREEEMEARRRDVYSFYFFFSTQAAAGKRSSNADTGVAFINRHMILSNRALAEGRPYTLFTSAAMHSSLTHLLFNSMALYTFGQNVNAMLGTRRFLGLYAVGALASSGTQSLFNAARHRYDQGTVGASGAVLALSAFSCAMLPGGRVRIYGVIPVPSWAFVVGIVGWSAYNMATEIEEDRRGRKGGGSSLIGSESGIAHAGHLGGAIAGLAFFLALRRGRLR